MENTESIKEETSPEEAMEKVKQILETADTLSKSLNHIQSVLTTDEWLYVCYGMYAALRYHDITLCRMAILDKVQQSGDELQKLVDKINDQITKEDTNNE